MKQQIREISQTIILQFLDINKMKTIEKEQTEKILQDVLGLHHIHDKDELRIEIKNRLDNLNPIDQYTVNLKVGNKIKELQNGRPLSIKIKIFTFFFIFCLTMTSYFILFNYNLVFIIKLLLWTFAIFWTFVTLWSFFNLLRRKL